MSLTDDIIDAASDRIPTWPGRWYSQETRREEMREVLEIAYRAGQIAQAKEDAGIVKNELQGSFEVIGDEISAAIYANAERLRAEAEGES